MNEIILTIDPISFILVLMFLLGFGMIISYELLKFKITRLEEITGYLLEKQSKVRPKK